MASIMSAMSIFDSLELLLSILVIGLNAYVVYFLTMNWSDLRKHAINGLVVVMLVNDTITILGLQSVIFNDVRLQLNMTVMNEMTCFVTLTFSIFSSSAHNIVFIFWVGHRLLAVYDCVKNHDPHSHKHWTLIASLIIGFGNILIAYFTLTPDEHIVGDCDRPNVMNGTQLTTNYIFTTVVDVVVYVGVAAILYYRNQLASRTRHSGRSSDGSLTTIESESDITNFVVHATVVHFICMSLPVVLLVVVDKIHEYGLFPTTLHLNMHSIAHLLHVVEPVMHGYVYIQRIKLHKERTIVINAKLGERSTMGFRKALAASTNIAAAVMDQPGDTVPGSLPIPSGNSTVRVLDPGPPNTVAGPSGPVRLPELVTKTPRKSPLFARQHRLASLTTTLPVTDVTQVD